jgi:hypothetical protein
VKRYKQRLTVKQRGFTKNKNSISKYESLMQSNAEYHTQVPLMHSKDPKSMTHGDYKCLVTKAVVTGNSIKTRTLVASLFLTRNLYVHSYDYK